MASYALSNTGSLNKNANQSYSTSGVIGGMSKPQTTTQSNQSLAQGNISGMMSKPDTIMKGVSTPPTVNIGGKEQVMKGSPSVLAQQKALNAQGAGLVEDGMAGEKTRAAIAQYGSAASQPKVETKTGTTGATTPETTPKVETPTPTPTPAPLTTPGLVPGLQGTANPTDYEKTTIGGLIGQSQNESPQVAEARKNLADFQRNLAETDKNIAGQGISLSSSRGQQYNIGQAAASELAALQGAVTNALTSQGQQITAGTAANTGAQTQAQRATGVAGTALTAVAPQFPSYSSQIVQPGLLGTTGGQTGQLPQEATDFINSLAQQVKSGMMTRGEAESKISQYSQPGLQAFNNALGSSFNTNASNASAGTTATGQQVSTFATSANAALDKLSTDFINLPDWQKMGIPGTIGIEQALGRFFGNDKLSTYQTTLHDARAQVSGVLATAGGMTPTSAGDTANAYLPDNMTKDQLAAKIAAVKTLIEQKVQAFQQSGAQNQTSGSQTGGGGLYNW